MDGITTQQIRSTPLAEMLVCQCARGDYYDGFVGEEEYATLMDGVTYDDSHVDSVKALATVPLEDPATVEIEAKTYALLDKLFTRGHWGAFEHPQITIGVKNVSRSCMAQITRHRHASFDVQSQRYVDFSDKDAPFKMPKSFVDPNHATRNEGPIDVPEPVMEEFQERYRDLTDEALAFYQDAVDVGFPKEDARFGLPIGTTVNWSMSVNASALLHIANVRAKGDAQWEAQELANKVLGEFAEWMPYTADLWHTHGPYKLTP